MRPTRLFLEGPGGQGKTTLLLKNMGALRMNAGGFVVRRLLDPEGKIRGFSLSSPGASDEASLPFAKSTENVFLERTESGVAQRLHVLEEGMLSLLDGCEHRKLIVVDEFGGIELLLPKIRARLAEILRARVPCIGVFKSRDNAKNMAETLGLPSEYFRRYNELRARIVDDFQAELLFFDSRTRREAEEAVASFCCGLRNSVPGRPSETRG